MKRISGDGVGVKTTQPKPCSLPINSYEKFHLMGDKKEYGCGKSFIYFFKFFSFNSFNPYRHGLNQVRMKQTVRSKVILS